jgi:UDP-N-acetylglucosamine:LPS N-acetylglucosamine transferase
MKKNILALISEGGGGHKSAGESLVQILEHDYDIDIVNGIGTILEPFDWFKRLTRGKISGESIYNWFLQTERGFLLRAYIFKGKQHLYNRKEKIARYFDRFIQSQNKKYDLIISTIPYVNHGITLTAKKHNIPFLLLPTDLDTTGFLNGFNDLTKEDFPLFKLALAYNRPEMLVNVFKNSHLEPEDIVFSGFPVRPACQIHYTPELLNLLKEKFGMEKDRLTITLVMGAAGSNGIIEHAKVLSSFDSSLQINVCVGRNEKSKKALIDWVLSQGGRILDQGDNLAKLETKNGSLLLVRGYTRDIISLLACADLVISKTGSCTVNEAIYLRKKLLLDNSEHSTARFLPWEEFNVWFVKRHKLGASFCKSEDLRSLVPFILKEERGPPHNLTLPDFQANIRTLVHDFTSGKLR